MRGALGRATRFPRCSAACWASYVLPQLWPPQASLGHRPQPCAGWGGSMTPLGSLRAMQMPNAWFLSCPL